MRHHLKNFTALIAEDESKARQEVFDYLSSFFHTIYLAHDGEEALKLYERHRPDFLLLDIHMPKIDGLEVARQVRERDNRTRIVMLSAHSDTPRLLAATEIDMTRYLVKPASMEDFKQMLDKVAKELLSLSANLVRLGPQTYYLMSEKSLYFGESSIQITTKESRLLELLLRHRNKPVTFESIGAELWEESCDTEVSQDSIKAQVSRLRRKLPEGSLESVYGTGYVLRIQ